MKLRNESIELTFSSLQSLMLSHTSPDLICPTENTGTSTEESSEEDEEEDEESGERTTPINITSHNSVKERK